MEHPTFIIDCPRCKVRVAAKQEGLAKTGGMEEHDHEPWGHRLYVGKCPVCSVLMSGASRQTHFDGWMGDEGDAWSEIVRVYPNPTRTFTSYRIPRVVTHSLLEADKSLQVGAYTAACVMMGRTLEAVCRDTLEPGFFNKQPPSKEEKKPKNLTLANGIQKLKDGGHIDERLYDWSQHLRVFRNIGAHAVDVHISREDADDLQAFVFAIIEYIYDLTDRYEDFKERLAAKEAKKK